LTPDYHYAIIESGKNSFIGNYIMRTNTKPNRHEKIAAVLKSGKPVTPNEIHAVFKDTDQEKVMYRLSTNIYNIRKDGGIVKVIKDGRKVQAYQLVNHEEFNDQGRYIGKVQPVTPVAPVAPVKPVQKIEAEIV
jgi:hypothetical protein